MSHRVNRLGSRRIWATRERCGSMPSTAPPEIFQAVEGSTALPSRPRPGRSASPAGSASSRRSAQEGDGSDARREASIERPLRSVVPRRHWPRTRQALRPEARRAAVAERTDRRARPRRLRRPESRSGQVRPARHGTARRADLRRLDPRGGRVPVACPPPTDVRAPRAPGNQAVDGSRVAAVPAGEVCAALRAGVAREPVRDSWRCGRGRPDRP